MITQVFTFGSGHVCRFTGKSLAGHYVTVVASTRGQCRALMVALFGRCWAFQYESADAAGVERYGLVEHARLYMGVPAAPVLPPSEALLLPSHAADGTVPAAVLPERTGVAGEPLPPLPESAYPPGAVPLEPPPAADEDAAEPRCDIQMAGVPLTCGQLFPWSAAVGRVTIGDRTGYVCRTHGDQATEQGHAVTPLHGAGAPPHGYVDGCDDECNNVQCPAGETHERCTEACASGGGR